MQLAVATKITVASSRMVEATFVSTDIPSSSFLVGRARLIFVLLS